MLLKLRNVVMITVCTKVLGIYLLLYQRKEFSTRGEVFHKNDMRIFSKHLYLLDGSCNLKKLFCVIFSLVNFRLILRNVGPL